MAALAAPFAPFAIAFTFVIMGLLSRRLGISTRAKRHYIGFFVAALLMLINAAAHLVYAIAPPEANSPTDHLRLFLIDWLPAIAATLAIIFAWRYWSWLLAERD